MKDETLEEATEAPRTTPSKKIFSNIGFGISVAAGMVLANKELTTKVVKETAKVAAKVAAKAV